MYKLSLTNDDIECIDDNFWELVDEKDDNVKKFALDLVRQCISKENFYEDIISKFIKKDWSIERLGDIEKCILKLAISEMLDGDTPDISVIDDFVFLTGVFTDNPKTKSFVNGLLENVRKKLILDDVN
jgi:N utilization substance protein B